MIKLGNISTNGTISASSFFGNIKTGQITLTGNYGSTLPSSGITGQIYYKKGSSPNSAPMMYAGTEYALDEYFIGKPVYMKVLAFNSLPNSTSTKVSHGLSSNCVIFARGGMAYYTSYAATSNMSLPHGEAIQLQADKSGVQITTLYDYSTYSAYVWIKYIYM